MAILTRLRRLDKSKKDKIVIFLSLIITVSIVVTGVFYKSFLSNSKNNPDRNRGQLNALASETKVIVAPILNDIGENISEIKESYNKHFLR